MEKVDIELDPGSWEVNSLYCIVAVGQHRHVTSAEERDLLVEEWKPVGLVRWSNFKCVGNWSPPGGEG